MATSERFDELLETRDKDLEPIADLWSWSLNYGPGKGPATAFLDLIGYSAEEFGEALYPWSDPQLGYLELGKLAAALDTYSNHPTVVRAFVEELLDAEHER